MIDLLFYMQVYFVLVVYPGLAGTYANGGMETCGFLLSVATAGLLQYATYRILKKLIKKRLSEYDII